MSAPYYKVDEVRLNGFLISKYQSPSPEHLEDHLRKFSEAMRENPEAVICALVNDGSKTSAIKINVTGLSESDDREYADIINKAKASIAALYNDDTNIILELYAASPISLKEVTMNEGQKDETFEEFHFALIETLPVALMLCLLCALPSATEPAVHHSGFGYEGSDSDSDIDVTGDVGE